MISTLLLTLLCVPLHAQDVRALMIGNSYTQANDLHLGFEAALEAGVPPWDDALVKALTQGGATLADHAAQADGTQGDTAWRQELVTGEDAGTWAWVILQDQSQVPGFPQSQAEWQASRDGAVVLDGLIEAGGAETVFLLTWGRRDGDEANPDRFPDFLTMQARLLEGYQAYADACAADGTRPWILPAGLAFQRVYQDLVAQGVTPEEEGNAFYQLYQADGSHPSAAGSYLTALTAVAALTGRDGASMSPPEGVDATLAATLQAAARAITIDDPLGEIDFRWVFSWDDWNQARSPDISDEVLAPLVYLDHPVTGVQDLQVGVGDVGRLWLLDGAQLDIADQLWIALGSRAEVRVSGGSLAVSSVEMDLYGGGDATLWVEGGTVTIGALSGEQGASVLLLGGTLQIGGGALPSPIQTGGTLVLGSGLRFTGDYALPPGASLTLSLTEDYAPWVSVDGDVTIEGDLTVQVEPSFDTCQGRFELLDAGSIALDPSSVTLPDGAQLVLLSRTGGQTLFLEWNPSVDCLEGEPSPWACACSGAGGAASVALPLVATALAFLRRRRGR
jgi:hypothetical protein